jgi:hypothetical protein
MPTAAPHLLVCVTAHGWGHLAQTVQIALALHARIPGLRLTVRTGLDAGLLRERFATAGLPVPAVLGDETDFGFEMLDALRIDEPASLRRYAALHADAGWLGRERDAVRALKVDAVLSNVGYMPLAAAASVGLPAFGVSSLNWADVLEAVFPERADVVPIVGAMRDAYDRADVLFALSPGMPFDRFVRSERVGPMARRGRARREALHAALGVPATQRVMVLAFGGLPMTLDTAGWRLPQGWTAVTLAGGVVETDSVRDGQRLGWPYIDLLASCDLLVCKPGYGTFAEAGFEGRDTIVVARDGWPESPWLIEWLSRHSRTAGIGVPELAAGRFDEALASIAAQASRPPARGDGASDVAERIAERLGVAPAALSPPGTGGRRGG